MKRVLVTGGTGLIGRPVLARLAKDEYEVHAVTSQLSVPCDLSEQAHTWHHADFLNESSVSALVDSLAPDVVFHLAWSVPLGGYDGEEHRTWAEASRRFFKLLLKKEGVRIVVAGSCFEYDWSNGLCREATTPTAASTEYGRSKDRLRRFLEESCKGTASSWAWARIFFVFGPHETPTRFVPAVVLGLLKGVPIALTHGAQVRDFLYSGEVASALVKMQESEFSGTCNVGSGAGITLRQIAEKIGERLGREELLEFGARAPAAHEPPTIVADIERLRTIVGWGPQGSLDDGLDVTIQWWKDELDRGHVR